MNELVSIIMPCYNSEKYIEETLNSVISQSYENWECIIVDDCSTDNSVEIIKEYCGKDSRIRLFINETNSGAAASRNKALRESKGKWIAFLDSDDLWSSDKLEKQINFMENNGYDFSYALCELIDENSATLGKYVTGPKKITRRKMFRYNYLTCLTVMYNRATVGDVQIDEAVGNGRNDYALWLKVSCKCTCYLLQNFLAKYRMRSSSLSHGHFFRLIKYHYELFRISEKMGRFQSLYHTVVNMIFGFWKKVFYLREVK